MLADTSNWWRYDPDGNWDDSEDLARYRVYEEEGEGLSPWHTYTLIATNAASRLTPGASDAVRAAGYLGMSTAEYEALPSTQLHLRWDEARQRLFAGENGVRCPVNDDAVIRIEWTAATSQSEQQTTYRKTGEHPNLVPEMRRKSGHRHNGQHHLTAPYASRTRRALPPLALTGGRKRTH